MQNSSLSGEDGLGLSKDPGPEGPAVVHPGGLICMVTFTSGDKVSGVSNRSRPSGSESLMKWTFFHRCWPSVATPSVFRVQDSIFTDT